MNKFITFLHFFSFVGGVVSIILALFTFIEVSLVIMGISIIARWTAEGIEK